MVVVGAGKMGEAILSGWLAAEEGPAADLVPESFTAVNPGAERRQALEERYGVACLEDASLVEAADVVVLAVKPQVMMDVLVVMRENAAFAGGERGPLFVSIAAGLSTSRLEEALPPGARLVRVMPNMPLLVGAGAASVTAGSAVLGGDLELVRDLFASLGSAVVVSEKDMDATCALNGSGPAYVAAMVEALRDAGVEQGLDAATAQDLALQTVLGTALLIKETGGDPAAVRESICSPGGTTLAALDAMAAAGFDSVFSAGVSAAVRRSKELASC